MASNPLSIRTGVAAILATLLPALTTRAADAALTISANPGKVDRAQTIASIPWPKQAPKSFRATTESGEPVPCQLDSSGNAWFLLNALKAEKPVTIKISAVANFNSKSGGVTLTNKDGFLSFGINGKPVTSYRADAGQFPRSDIPEIYKRGGYLHPFRTPSGRLVTDDYSTNHLHHHGVWSAWTKTEFQGRKPDFWNMGQGKARVDFEALAATWSGPVQAGFRSSLIYTDTTTKPPVVALREEWTVRVLGLNPSMGGFAMDLVSTQTCATGSPLILPTYHYGGIGLRGHSNWNAANNFKVLTSDGETDRIKANETRGRWCYMGGTVDNAQAGIVIFCHPSNFRAPQPMRVNPTEPFFCYAPSQLGEWSIKPGEPYVSQYRIMSWDGPPDKKTFDAIWQDYAEPVTISFVQP